MSHLVKLSLPSICTYRIIHLDFLILFEDWQARFQTKCYGCQFPIEPGDRWVEALSQNWHSECFNCSVSYNVHFCNFN